MSRKFQEYAKSIRETDSVEGLKGIQDEILSDDSLEFIDSLFLLEQSHGKIDDKEGGKLVFGD